MKPTLLLSVLIFCSFIVNAEEQTEKHHEDPTKVITRVGFGYTDELTVSGSLALDQTRKINARTNKDLSEWRLGGSWLFDFGIINFNLSRTDYDDGGHKNNYSIGTFLPLNVFGVDTGKWMVFPMAGFNHNSGEIRAEEDPSLFDEVVMVQNTSNGGYLGVMALRPISETWTFMTFGGGGMGSGGYSNVWGGGGFSYKINTQHSFNFFGFISEDDFGSVNKVGMSYTYEFE